MCGISGIVSFGNAKKRPNIKAEIASMTDAIRHRGPDDEGFYEYRTISENEPQVGLGHCRLSIIDLVGGHQPLCNEDKSIWITYNGEIYNYVELREELLKKGHRFETNSDTEAILHLYEEFQEKCLGYLNGMFAFCIWDKRRRRIFAARDRFGIKPFYYYLDEETFIFASEIKALLRNKIIAAEPNPEALREYSIFQFCLGEKTFFKGIHKLTPGSCILLDAVSGRHKIHNYWNLDYNNVDEEKGEEDFARELLFLIRDAIRLQSRSDVPLGAHLSGGMDSSLIACAASRIMKGKIDTFSGGFEERGFHEFEYARIVSGFAGTRHHEILIDSSRLPEELPRLIRLLDEPVGGPGVFPQYFVCKYAKRRVKVVLGGQGGDELFAGYARYLIVLSDELAGRRKAGKLPERYFDRILAKFPVLKNYRTMLRSYHQSRHRSSVEAYFSLVDRTAAGNRIYSGDFFAGSDHELIFEKFEKIFNSVNSKSALNKMSYFDTVSLLPALLQVEDRTSMGASLESRVPLLDHRIAELIGTMPPGIKFKDGELKYILRRAAKGVIPREVLSRTDKMGFPVPMFLKKSKVLRDFAYDILFSPKARQRNIFDTDFLRKTLDRAETVDREIWGALCLELWHREFVDKRQSWSA